MSNFTKFDALRDAGNSYLTYLSLEEKIRPITDADYEIFYKIEAIKKTVTDKLDYPRSEGQHLPLLRYLDKKLKEKIAEEDAIPNV